MLKTKLHIHEGKRLLLSNFDHNFAIAHQWLAHYAQVHGHGLEQAMCCQSLGLHIDTMYRQWIS